MKTPSAAIKVGLVSFFVVIVFFGTGCASIVHGGSREIIVNSTPQGAKVTVTKENTDIVVYQGVTPASIWLSPKKSYFKGQSYKLKLEIEGHHPSETIIKPQLSSWYIGNILFGGLIGMVIVDPQTGAMWDLAPVEINQKRFVPLQGEGSDEPPKPPSVIMRNEWDSKAESASP